MVQGLTITPTSGVWRPLAAWPGDQRPVGLWSWLTHAGSLTEKLRVAAGAVFHVQVLNEDETQLCVEDAGLLALPPGAAARRREVYLCGREPWVYARTLAAVRFDGRWLAELGVRPLGERVFAEPDTQRGPIEIARLGKNHPLYSAAVRSCKAAPAALWARRSVLRVRDARLLIYECFLREGDC